MRAPKYLIGLLLPLLLSTTQAAEPPPPRLLHLDEIEKMLGERNRSLLAARRASAAGEAAIDTAAGRPNPFLSLNSSGINNRNPGSRTLDTVLRLDQPIERGGKRDLRLAVATSMLDANHADESDTLRQQRLQTRQAYFDLKAAEEKARSAGQSALLAGQVLSKAELRLKAGDLSSADVGRIRADSVRADSDAIQARIELQRAQLALARLLALESQAAQLSAADPWPALTPLPSVQPDIEQRPDIVAARQRLTAAEHAIDLAKAQQVRDVVVGAQVERTRDDPANRTTVGFGVSIPLLTGYDYRGEIRRAYVERDAANDELERLRTTAAAEFSEAVFTSEHFSERARRLQDEALPAMRKAHAAVQLAFTHGAASILDVIDARRSLYAIETDTANALADAAKARAAWAAALNRPDLP